METSIARGVRPTDAAIIRFLNLLSLELQGLGSLHTKASRERVRIECDETLDALRALGGESSPARFAEREVINAARTWRASIATPSNPQHSAGVRDGSSDSLHRLFEAVDALEPMYAYPLSARGS